MSNMILMAVLVLGVTGAVFALVLYFVAQKFKVNEDPLIDEIEAVLPGANCGGCGKSGCRALAEAFVKQHDMEGLHCPVGGDETASKVAALLGVTIEAGTPQVAVLRCNGSCSNAQAKAQYDGLQDCAFLGSVFGGESGCAFGCVGLGNCVKSCKFDALALDAETGLPVVDEDKCVACGACVKACPRSLLELRNKGPKGHRVYVACRNKEKGGEARKSCSVACIGCGACQKACPFEAIVVENNLAYIDFNKCKMCRKCVSVCPTGAIHAVNFPPLPPAAVPASKVEPPLSAAQPLTEEKRS
ncbi:MAG: RnfABCDGE type electron transport complex subunit B [Bacteroidales bacterium]|nr:RnfABCDGE type electron transport complex subunit B [Bacteroidales bacterium]